MNIAIIFIIQLHPQAYKVLSSSPPPPPPPPHTHTHASTPTLFTLLSLSTCVGLLCAELFDLYS